MAIYEKKENEKIQNEIFPGQYHELPILERLKFVWVNN